MDNIEKNQNLTDDFRLFIDELELLNLTVIQNEIHPKITSFANDYIENLNYSILSGEYFSEEDFTVRLQNGIDKINEIDEIIRNNIENIVLGGTEGEKDEIGFYEDSFYEITKYLTSLLKTYLEFTEQQVYNLDLDIFERKENSFINFMEFSNYMYSKKDKFKQGLSLLKLNLELSEIDHSLSVEAVQYHRLEKIEKELIDADFSSFETIKEILYEKCIFLAKKILGRIDKDDNKKLYNRTYRGVFTNLVENREFIYYKKFNDLLQIQSKDEHFQIDDFVKSFNSQANTESLNFTEVFFTVKQYKFKNKLSKLDTVIKKIEGELEKNVSVRKFDKIAQQINLNYSVNNKISPFVKIKKNLDLEKILEKISIIQEDTGIKNYFPYYRVVKSILEDVKHILNVDIEEKHILEIQTQIKDIGDYLYKFQENLEWCKELKFQYYQLPFDECRFEIPIGNENRILFLASSFIFPVNYEKLKNQIDKNYQDFIRYETNFSFKKEILKEKKDILSIKDELDRSTRKEIEILGVFSALVLFSAGELQLFSKISNTHEILLHSLGLAYGLGLFVLLTWVISRDFRAFRPSTIHWIIMGVFVLSTSSIFVFLMNNSSKTSQQISIEIMKYKLDSMQIQNKIDSSHKVITNKMKKIK